MATKGSYPRWLGDSATWVAEDDWDPSEYLEWFQRLADAKKNLKDTYVDVDYGGVELVKALCHRHESKMPQQLSKNYDYYPIARLIVRFGVAYNFYNRITFEDVPDEKAVARVKKYLPRIGTGMCSLDIARMLQAAADKEPFAAAVYKMVADYTKSVGDALPLLTEWHRTVQTRWGEDSAYCHAMQTYSKNGIPTVEELPAILLEAQKPDEVGTVWVTKKRSEKALEVLNSDERIKQFLSVMVDPAVTNAVGYVRKEIESLKVVLNSGDLFRALNEYAALEKDKLSWSKTVGPACVAIVRLGKRSQGKDFEKLAEYARKHSKRQR